MSSDPRFASFVGLFVALYEECVAIRARLGLPEVDKRAMEAALGTLRVPGAPDKLWNFPGIEQEYREGDDKWTRRCVRGSYERVVKRAKSMYPDDTLCFYIVGYDAASLTTLGKLPECPLDESAMYYGYSDKSGAYPYGDPVSILILSNLPMFHPLVVPELLKSPRIASYLQNNHHGLLFHEEDRYERATRPSVEKLARDAFSGDSASADELVDILVGKPGSTGEQVQRLRAFHIDLDENGMPVEIDDSDALNGAWIGPRGGRMFPEAKVSITAACVVAGKLCPDDAVWEMPCVRLYLLFCVFYDACLELRDLRGLPSLEWPTESITRADPWLIKNDRKEHESATRAATRAATDEAAAKGATDAATAATDAASSRDDSLRFIYGHTNPGTVVNVICSEKDASAHIGVIDSDQDYAYGSSSPYKVVVFLGPAFTIASSGLDLDEILQCPRLERALALYGHSLAVSMKDGARGKPIDPAEVAATVERELARHFGDNIRTVGEYADLARQHAARTLDRSLLKERFLAAIDAIKNRRLARLDDLALEYSKR